MSNLVIAHQPALEFKKRHQTRLDNERATVTGRSRKGEAKGETRRDEFTPEVTAPARHRSSKLTDILERLRGEGAGERQPGKGRFTSQQAV